MSLRKTILRSGFLLPVLASGVFGWTYSSPTATGTCGNLAETGSTSDFTFTSIVNKALFPSPGVSDGLKMAFVMPSDTSTHADIILIERFGAVKYYDAAAKTFALIGTIPVTNGTEDGLVGVAVERPFKNRVYVTYSRGSGANTAIGGSFRLSRFSMNPATHMLDMGSEKVILDVPSARNRWHTSGALESDNEGNLYWAVGDNETAFTGPANTHDLRGSIVRIHPNDDGNGYTIPPGNFAEYWANKFTAQGRTALAAKYKDTSKVRPEIFVKGIRNTYAISVDPHRKQVAYGQCGPDYGGNSELHSNTLTPTFAGWPFWSGSTTVAPSQASTSQYGKNGSSEPASTTWDANLPASKDNPVNKWAGTMAGTPGPGVDTLPPFAPAKYVYGHSCAMGSLIVRYDGRVKNPGKLPPHMDNVWLVGDYNTRRLSGAKVDTNGTVTGTFNTTTGIFSTGRGAGGGIGALVDLQQGPDGALYVANLNCTGGFESGPTKYSDACSGVLRIEYKGNCADTALHPPGNPVTGILARERIERGAVDWVSIGPGMFSVLADGPHAVRILDLRGRVAASMLGEGRKEYAVPASLGASEVYLLEVKSMRGINISGFFHP